MPEFHDNRRHRFELAASTPGPSAVSAELRRITWARIRAHSSGPNHRRRASASLRSDADPPGLHWPFLPVSRCAEQHMPKFVRDGVPKDDVFRTAGPSSPPRVRSRYTVTYIVPIVAPSIVRPGRSMNRNTTVLVPSTRQSGNRGVSSELAGHGIHRIGIPALSSTRVDSASARTGMTVFPVYS